MSNGASSSNSGATSPEETSVQNKGDVCKHWACIYVQNVHVVQSLTSNFSIAELYIILAKFLSLGPCQNAYKVWFQMNIGIMVWYYDYTFDFHFYLKLKNIFVCFQALLSDIEKHQVRQTFWTFVWKNVFARISRVKNVHFLHKHLFHVNIFLLHLEMICVYVGDSIIIVIVFYLFRIYILYGIFPARSKKSGLARKRTWPKSASVCK